MVRFSVERFKGIAFCGFTFTRDWIALWYCRVVGYAVAVVMFPVAVVLGLLCAFERGEDDAHT